MTLVPLDLYCEVITADGVRWKWDANQPPSSRLRNLNFSTKIGEGFSLATGTLARRIDLDYPDLQLGMDIVITGADGHIVFEGRLSAMPREVGQTHSINVTFVGHMAHAKDRQFTGIYVDRDLGAWQGMSAARRAALLISNITPYDGQQQADPTDNTAVLFNGWTGPWASPYTPISELWYDAGPGNTIAKVGYGWRKNGPATDPVTFTAWQWLVGVADDDKAASATSTGDISAAGPSTAQTYTPATARRWAFLQAYYGTTPGGADSAEYGVAWSKLAVYGDHGLTTYTGDTSEPPGLYVTDILRHIAQTYCPELNTDGVEDFEYVVQHCAYRDGTFPYDAFLGLNKYALQHLAVWENKTLTFRPYDLTDYDWEIRTDDPGTTFAPVGPTVDDLYNAVEVTYTDIQTGVRNILTPDDYDELQDTSLENPWNQRGRYHPLPLELSTPVLEADAVQIARAALADKNRPKTAGTITVQGYLRDRAGNPQPVSRVRAGDVICVTNFNEINRLIVETDNDDETKTMRIAVDLPFELLEALMDRQANARQARGLG